MNFNRDVAVLVSSCDQYEEAWEPFFALFKKHWECPYKVYLNTETKDYSKDGVVTLNCKRKNATWSVRLKQALGRIHSKFVIFFLEDFFLLDRVDQAEIDRCVGIMEKDRSISVIDFEYFKDPASVPSGYDGYRARSLRARYFLNCQTAIWRRKDLMRYLNRYESPWQFELFGSERAKLYGKKFLFSDDGWKLPFLYNVNWNTGYGIHHGKWLKSNVALFAQNGIDFDFGKVEFYEGGDTVDTGCEPPKKSFRERWMYFIYGGGKETRTGIGAQILFSVRHPVEGLRVLKRKLKYLLTDDRNF